MDTRDEQLTPPDVEVMTWEECFRALIDSYKKYGIQSAEELEDTVRLRGIVQSTISLFEAVDIADSLHEQRKPLYEKFCPPRETIAFLKTLFPLFHAQLPQGLSDEPLIKITESHENSKAAYLRGCAQGYIEGRVADRAPKQAGSRKANAAKRKKRQQCGEHMMTLDERDAAIVAEYPRLLALKIGTKEDVQQRLAWKYGLESGKQVRNIIKNAKRKTPSESSETP